MKTQTPVLQLPRQGIQARHQGGHPAQAIQGTAHRLHDRPVVVYPRTESGAEAPVPAQGPAEAQAAGRTGERVAVPEPVADAVAAPEPAADAVAAPEPVAVPVAAPEPVAVDPRRENAG